MGLSEADFLAQLLATFKVEAEEHLQALSNGLIVLEKEPAEDSKQEKLEEVFREAHNLKGAARAVNQADIESLCQSMENVLSALRNNKLTLSTPLFDTLYATIDLITSAVGNINKESSGSDKKLMQEMIKRLESAKEGNVVSPETQTEKGVSAETKEPENSEEPQSELPLPDEPNLEDKTIRVSSKKLDRLLQQVEEMLIVKLTSQNKVSEIQDLAKEIEQLEKQWKRVHTDSRLLKQNLCESMAYTSKEKAFFIQVLQFLDWQQEFLTGYNEKLEAIKKNTKQEHRLVTNMVDALLDDTKQVLMQPFSTMLVSLPRMVRDISHTLGKKILFQTDGGDTEVDRRILEELKDPIIHLIRNSIDHGIENPEARKGAGKPEEGTVRIDINQASGNKVIVTLSDDGKGIDVEQVKKSALKQGTATQKEIDEMSDEQALRLIFQSGISTAQIISDLSGRGLGMGIVTEKVEKLGGEIFLDSETGKGTAFKIVLPITLATFRGIHVRVSDRDFIVPSHHVKRSFRASKDAIRTVENKPTIIVDEKPIAYVHLANALEVNYIPKKDSLLHVLVIKAAEITIAIGVDQIINEQEVFVKNLGPQLIRVRNIAAATIMEAGKVVPIIDPFDLVKSVVANSGEGAVERSINTTSDEEAAQKEKIILIVEDSVTARILLKNILSSAGYTIKTAVDGVEALSILKTEPVDLLMTDIEMPRMNGFELTEKTRAIDDFKNLPIVICTSLGSQEDRERGIDAGANAYIKKSNFTQNHLLEIVKQLL